MNPLLGLIILPATCFGAFQFFNPTDTAAVPKLLSQTGLYTNITGKVTDTALKYFEVNAPLWSDGAAKQRWIVLPPGAHVAYVDSTDAFTYPDGSVFVKNFLLERTQGDSLTRVLWETRLLVNRKSQGRDVWYGFSYRWKADASDAGLVPATGFDTIFAFYPNGMSRPQSYRKWHYPSQYECRSCHVRTNMELPSPDARGILGFFPAQLKRPSTGDPARNQVDVLFDAGVFSGTRPSAAQLAKRWKSVRESIPVGTGSDARFRVLDTMARAYLAANCSGCHGDRGIRHSASVPETMNFDFHDFRPRQELGMLTVADTKSLDDPEIVSTVTGRGYYLAAVARAGLDTTAGSDWNLNLPPPAQGPPAFVYPGYPSVSLALYRQFVRRSPWRDSLVVRGALGGEDPQGWGTWMFSVPWGSEPWRDLLAAHSVKVNEVVEYVRDGGSSGGQMPPLPTSFIPDTAALRVLGEWVRHYRTLYVVDSSRIITGVLRAPAAAPMPMVRGRVVTWNIEGSVTLATLRGQKVPLIRAGRKTWMIPASVSPGLYLLRAGGAVRPILLKEFDRR